MLFRSEENLQRGPGIRPRAVAERSEALGSTMSQTNSYKGRLKNLRLLGFSGYRAYLDSSLWQRVRVRAFKERGNVCQFCGAPARELHHTDYSEEVLRGDRCTSIVPLCHDCHMRIEFDGRGVKRGMKAARLAYYEELWKLIQETPGLKEWLASRLRSG